MPLCYQIKRVKIASMEPINNRFYIDGKKQIDDYDKLCEFVYKKKFTIVSIYCKTEGLKLTYVILNELCDRNNIPYSIAGYNFDTQSSHHEYVLQRKDLGSWL